MSKLEIVINSCDAYEDVWAPFFHALRGNWAGEVPPIILNSERKTYALDGLRIRRPPALTRDHDTPDDWGGRLLAALACVDAEFVLVAFDDHIVEGSIDTDEIERCTTRLAREQDVCAFYLINPSLPLLEDADDARFAEVKPGADYILNSAPGLWRKTDLISFVRPGDDPWAWEYFGSARLIASGKRAFAPQAGQPPVYPYQHSFGGAIYRGKWVARVIEPVLEKYGLRLDLEARGIAEPKARPHGLGWRLRFFITGFRMVGFRALCLTLRALSRKLVKVVMH